MAVAALAPTLRLSSAAAASSSPPSQTLGMYASWNESTSRKSLSGVISVSASVPTSLK